MIMIGDIEISVYEVSKTATITKHYNSSVNKTIRLNEDDIIHMEFAIKEIKRKLGIS